MDGTTFQGLADAGLATLGGAGRMKRGAVRRSRRARRRAAETERREAAKAFARVIGEPVPAIFDGHEICEADEGAVEAAAAACPMLVRLAMTFARIDEEWGLGD